MYNETDSFKESGLFYYYRRVGLQGCVCDWLLASNDRDVRDETYVNRPNLQNEMGSRILRANLTFGLGTPEHRARVPVQRVPVVGLLETLCAGSLERQSLRAVFAAVVVHVVVGRLLAVRPLVHEPHSLLVVRRTGELSPVVRRKAVPEPFVSRRKGLSALRRPRRRFDHRQHGSCSVYTI